MTVVGADPSPSNIAIADGVHGVGPTQITVSGGDLPSAIIANPGLGIIIKIFVESVDEVYSNPFIVFVPPQTTPNESLGAKSAKMVNLMMIQDQYMVTGHINSADRVNLRLLFHSGTKANNTLLFWDGIADPSSNGEGITGAMSKLTISKKANENDEWPVQLTFCRADPV